MEAPVVLNDYLTLLGGFSLTWVILLVRMHVSKESLYRMVYATYWELVLPLTLASLLTFLFSTDFLGRFISSLILGCSVSLLVATGIGLILLCRKGPGSFNRF